MKRIISILLATALAVSSATLFTACSGTDRAKRPEAGEQLIEVMAISKYTRIELGMLMEFDVSNHQVNENGQITQFDLNRTRLEKVLDNGALLQYVETEDSTISLVYDETGRVTSARTDIPGYGYTVHELTYNDGLIDTDAYDTDWSVVDKPYKLQFNYEKNDGTVIKSEGKRLSGVKSTYPCEYEYNEKGDVKRIIRTATPDFIVYVDIEYDENGCVTKITSTNPDGVFLVCEFEYISLGEIGKQDTVKTGFRKWQEFSVVEEALKNCF